MKPKEQQIAIAEACGLIVTDTGVCFKDEQECLLPDYLNDLNAMHEAAHYLREHGDQFQWLDYHKQLRLVVWGSQEAKISWSVIEATAKQRAEAFLRTIGKWKE